MVIRRKLKGTTRKFNGKTYTYNASRPTKASAKRTAETGRKKGFLMRITKEKSPKGKKEYATWGRKRR